MAIYLDDYRKARDLKLRAGSSGGELQYENWTPNTAGAAAEPSPHLPADFVGTDMRALMQRLRALASQI